MMNDKLIKLYIIKAPNTLVNKNGTRGTPDAHIILGFKSKYTIREVGKCTTNFTIDHDNKFNL